MEVLRTNLYSEGVGGAPAPAASPGRMQEAQRHDPKTQPEVSQPREDAVSSAVDRANRLSAAFDRGLKFEYRAQAGVFQVSVIDTSRDEVVRKIPPDEVVRFIERVKDLFGALIDVQA